MFPFEWKKENLFQFVGNKAKQRISKRVFQENKGRQIFRKTNISYPLKIHKKDGKNFFFKTTVQFLSYYTR